MVKTERRIRPDKGKQCELVKKRALTKNGSNWLRSNISPGTLGVSASMCPAVKE